MGKLPFEYLKREVLVRKDAITDPNYGCAPHERPIEDYINYGIVNIDKPAGPTSHQISDFVQRIIHVDKSGHSGTLDPNVTGVLPIAIGRATRIVQTLLTAGKEYITLMHLHKEVEEKKLAQAFKAFSGKIMQLPPIKSAVKRVEREREIYYIDVLEIQDKDVLFYVGCQAGTYIRKLCYDIGKKLGTGAHMAELRRTKAGPFDESTLTTLQELSDAYHFYKEENNEKLLRSVIQPMENGINHIAKVWVLDTTVNSLCHGVDLKVPGISKAEGQIEENDRVAILTLKGELICIGTSKMKSKEMLQEKGLAIKTEKVFMPESSYKLN